MNIITGWLSKMGFYKLKEVIKIADTQLQNKIKDINKINLISFDSNKNYLERDTIISYQQMLSLFKRSEWIRANVDVIANCCAKAKMVIRLKEGIIESKETDIQIAKIKALFDNPNERDETFMEIRKRVITSLLIYDAAAIELVYSVDGTELLELYDIQGENIRFNVDKHGYFKDKSKAYIYIPTNVYVPKAEQFITFAHNELIYFKLRGIAGSLYGLSPIESLVTSIRSDINASIYNASFFDNNATVAGILSIPGLSDAELKLFKNQYYRNTRGAKNSHKLLISNAAGMDFKKMAENSKDMQFMEYQRWIVQKIMAVYSTNPFVLGLIDSNTGKLNSKEQWNSFIEKAVQPILSLEGYLYTSKILQLGMKIDNIEITFEDLTVADSKVKAEEAKIIVTSDIMSINEVRQRYFKLPEVSWGNVPYDILKAGLIPVKPNNPTPIKKNEELIDEPKPEIEENESLSLRAKILNMIDDSITEKPNEELTE